MRLPDRLRLPLSFDPDRLARDMRAVESSGWIAHFVPQNYEGDWSVIPLRGRAGATHPIMMISADPSCQDFEDAPMLAACRYFREVFDTFEAPLRSVRLMRLTPGSVIKEHTDLELSFEEGTVRIHVPVVTNADVDFRLNRQRVMLEAAAPGTCGCPIRTASPIGDDRPRAHGDRRAGQPLGRRRAGARPPVTRRRAPPTDGASVTS